MAEVPSKNTEDSFFQFIGGKRVVVLFEERKNNLRIDAHSLGELFRRLSNQDFGVHCQELLRSAFGFRPVSIDDV